MQSILDGVTVGMSQCAERQRPAVIENEQLLEREVHVAAG